MTSEVGLELTLSRLPHQLITMWTFHILLVLHVSFHPVEQTLFVKDMSALEDFADFFLVILLEIFEADYARFFILKLFNFLVVGALVRMNSEEFRGLLLLVIVVKGSNWIIKVLLTDICNSYLLTKVLVSYDVLLNICMTSMMRQNNQYDYTARAEKRAHAKSGPRSNRHGALSTAVHL